MRWKKGGEKSPGTDSFVTDLDERETCEKIPNSAGGCNLHQRKTNVFSVMKRGNLFHISL